MSDESLEILWRGSDPAKFTALQAALRDEGIRFCHLLAHDHAGGFLNSRPYYLEAMPGFEVRVYAADLDAARDLLDSLESKAAEYEIQPSARREFDGPIDYAPMLPIEWDPGEATAEVWSGDNESQAEYIASSLAENGIPCRIPDEPGHGLRLRVRPREVSRAKD